MSSKEKYFLLKLLTILLLIFVLMLLVPKVASSQSTDDETKPQTDKKTSKNPKDNPDEIGDRSIGKGVNLYSIEKEMALGKQLAQEVEKNVKIIDDPIIAEYINRLGQNIVRNSDAKVPFTIKVVDSQEVNAFALPGGFFFVNTGLILKADNEAELAGVMAHEIAHVAARHGTKQASRAQIANYASLPLIFIGGGLGTLARLGSGAAVPLTFVKFSRGFEEEADFLGLQYLYKAGYDPTCFIDFFERIESLEKTKPGTLSKVFATHPPTENRIAKSQKEIQKILLAKSEYVINTSEFADVKEQLYKMLNRRKDDREKTGPTLRRSGSTDKIGDEDKTKPDQDERPTLKRRDP